MSVPTDSDAVGDPTDNRLPKRVLAVLLYRVRSPEGHIVSYRNDGIALGLHLSHWALLIATPLVVWRSESVRSWWWALLLLSATADILARIRLRRFTRLTEGQGAALKPSFDSRLTRHSCDSLARRCDAEEEKMLARAAEAELRGDHHAADNYRNRADRERKRAQELRGLAP